MARALVVGARAPQPLRGSWEVARVEHDRTAAPERLTTSAVEWIACDGPVPVAAALRAAGWWDGTRAFDFDADDWWYRCRFTVPATDGPLRLRFDGLATVTDVWLNDEHILRSASMFVAHTVDVAHALRADNTLLIRCAALRPLLDATPSRPRPRWRAALVEHQALRWVRTSLLGRMRPWCPPIAPVGPWRPIAVETSPIQIEHADVDARVDGSDGMVRLRLRVRTSPDGARPALTLSGGTFHVGGSHARIESERVADDVHVLTSTMRVSNPELWWPHTHGTPFTYQVGATLTGDIEERVDLGRVGFRTVAPDCGLDGRGFGLVVNGTSVFCRGVCWTPLDLTRLSADPSAYRLALNQLRDAGMNMVRIAGTTTYESDTFYDLCDELGLLVWQDFMFANMDYPWQDADFSRAALLEAAQVLESLQARPSLAVVCGSSEVHQQAAMLGLPPTLASSSGNEDPLAGLVHSSAPDVVWLPTTPTGGTLPFHVDSGVSHYFGVGAYRRPFDDARRAQVRFAAECLAFANVAEPASLQHGRPLGTDWKARVPRDAGADWDFEDVRDYYAEQLFDVRTGDLRVTDPDRYLALGRVATGEAMLRTFAEWRRPGSSCRGGLVWFARDLTPGSGWGVIDSTGRAKSVYWYLKRVLAPIALLCADEGLNGLWLHALNDSPDAFAGDLRVALYGAGRMRGRPVSVPLDVAPRGSQSVHVDGLFGGFLDLTYAYRFGPPQHDVVSFALVDRTGELRATACYFPGHLPCTPDAELRLTAEVEPAAEGYVLTLEANRFAHAVAIDISGFAPDDNYLSLEPAQPRHVTLRSLEGATTSRIPEGRVTALNGSGPVSIVVPEVVDAG